MNNREELLFNLKATIIICVLNGFLFFYDLNTTQIDKIDISSLESIIKVLISPLFSIITVWILSKNNLKYFKSRGIKNFKVGYTFSLIPLIITSVLFIIIVLVICLQLEVDECSSSSAQYLYIHFKTDGFLESLNNYIPHWLIFKLRYIVWGKGLSILFQSLSSIVKARSSLNANKEAKDTSEDDG